MFVLLGRNSVGIRRGEDMNVDSDQAERTGQGLSNSSAHSSPLMNLSRQWQLFW